MLLAFRDGEASEVAGGGEEEGLGEVAVVIVVVPAALAAQHHHRFGALPVAVDRQHGAGLDGVEHALGTVLFPSNSIHTPIPPRQHMEARTGKRPQALRAKF